MRVALSRKWIIRPWQIEACGLYLGQHVVIVGLVALFQHVLQSVGVPPVNGAHGYSVLDPFMWWDSGWYSHIARLGYDIPPTAAFPPLYPLLEALVAPLVGSSAVAGLVIANLAGLGACLLLRVVLDPLIGARTSQRTLFYLLCFPTAVFFLAAYTESLFLLLSLAVFAALHRRAFWWAGLFAGLAIMTRYTGICLILPLLLALYQARAVWWRYLSAAIAPVLLGGFWVFLIARFHELPSTAVSQYYRTQAWPWVGLIRSISYLTTGGHTVASYQDTARDLILTLVLLALALAVFRSRLPLTFKVYTGAILLFVLSNPVFYAQNYNALFSVPRYLLPIFPLFIPLAQLSLRSKGLQLALFATMLLLSMYFLAGFSAEWLIA